MGDVGLILCLTLLVKEVSFLAKQVSRHLDVICPIKSASKANLSNQPCFDHLTCVDDFSQMARPNLVKPFSLKNTLFEISYDSGVIKFGQKNRGMTHTI